MCPRPTLYKPLESVRLAPARLSSSLPFLSFQSLTNCPICKPFVLTFIQNAGGVGVPHLFSPPNNTTLPLHLCESLCSRRLCVIFFRSLPPVTIHESQVTAFKLFGSAEFFCISVAAHEQKLALLY